MKNKSNIIYQNILNLTSLWEELGNFDNSFVRSSLFNHNINWPRRLWFNNDFDLETLSTVKAKVFTDYTNLIIPYWDIYGSNSNLLLEQNGFKKVFEQIGMSLKLDNSFEEQSKLKINLVSTEEDAIIWSKLFEASFGYEIPSSIVVNTTKTINYYIAYSQGNAIGTAMTYQTGKITGLHSVGIIPEGRQKGLANELMKILLNIAITDKSEYATLQASNMGKGLYLNLGFKEEFTITNYSLTNP